MVKHSRPREANFDAVKLRETNPKKFLRKLGRRKVKPCQISRPRETNSGAVKLRETNPNKFLRKPG